MRIEKIQIKKISETIGGQIEALISQGNYGAGEKLPSVRELCEIFGAGRSAVRDALTVLKGKGIIEIKQGEGAYVCEFHSSKMFNPVILPLDAKDLSELFQIRKMMEPDIVEIAAVCRSDEQLRQMLKTLSLEGWESDYEFHRLIAKACGNATIIELLDYISIALKQSMMDLYQVIDSFPDEKQKINEQHQAIFHLIQAQKAAAAKQEMINHLQLVEQLFLRNVLKN